MPSSPFLPAEPRSCTVLPPHCQEHACLFLTAEEEQFQVPTQEGKCINLILIPESNYIKPGSQVN